MSLKHVLEKLNHIASSPSTLSKIHILKGYLLDEEFKKVCNYALASKYVFHVKKFPPFKPLDGDFTNNLAIFDILEKLNASDGANNTMKEVLYNAASTDPETYEVVRRICEGDLKCGVGIKNINKAVPGTIFYIPYMRCSTEAAIGNITYPAYAQEKNDGAFTNMIVKENGGITFFTRNGKAIHQLQALKRALKPFVSRPPYAGMVYMGELLVMVGGRILPRSEGNGIITSCIYGTANQSMADKVIIRVWDCVLLSDFWDGESKIPYSKRFNTVKQLAEEIASPTFKPTFTELVNNEVEARNFYAKIRRHGGEGEVLKSMNFHWKDHDSPYQIKLVNTSSAELRIVGWNYGAERSKYEHVCGAVLMESECGMLKVKVSGMTDEQRAWDWDSHIGDIATVKFKELSQGKGNQHMSMTHPRIDELRLDRRTAQTLKDILKREHEGTGEKE